VATVLTQIPDAFSSGSTVVYTRSFSDYPQTAGWTLTLLLAGVGYISIPAAANGAGFTVTIFATQTATLPPGMYRWLERVAKSPEIYDVGAGVTSITPNLAVVGPGDMQTFEEKALVVVEAAILASAGSAMVSYQLHGRGMTTETRKDAIKFRDALVTRIQRQRTGRIGQQLLTRFTGTARGRGTWPWPWSL
jgi:hypothetical protein